MKSSLSTTVAAGYSAESVRLALVGGSLDDANTAVRKHVAFLEEARPVLGDFAYHADKMRVLASFAIRQERSGLVADAERTREKALESCRFAKLDRCSVEEMRVLGERAYRQ